MDAMQYFSIAAWIPVIGLSAFAAANLPELPALVKDHAAQLIHITQSILYLVCMDPNLFLFLVLALRYYRLVGHLYAYLFLYKANTVPAHPTVTGDNVHVVISTVEPTNQAFPKCVRSILENKPRWLTIAVGGEQHLPPTYTALQSLQKYHGSTEIQVISVAGNKGDKRKQMTMVLDQLATNRNNNEDTIVVFVDDHAWWNGNTFLAHLLAPFEDPKVGLVGTKKRVQREHGDHFVLSILNFLACIYLERHNFDITAQNAIDGGAFVISARTCAVRASIVMEDEFRHGFMNEYFFFGQLGPLRPDDDNYITRFVVRAGYAIKFQNHPNSIMHTTLGVDGATLWKKIHKFHGQLLRWARSQWRSNTASLITDRSVWRRQWLWTAHAGLITSLISGALIWDTLIIYAWSQSSFGGFTWYHLAAIIIGSKMVKLVDFFHRNPRDLKYFPLYLIFAYVHTFYKLWALITFWDHRWAGRGADVVADAGPSNSNDDDNNDDDDAADDDNRSAPRAADSSAFQRVKPSVGTSTTAPASFGPHDHPTSLFAPSNAYKQPPSVESVGPSSPAKSQFASRPGAPLESASSSRSSSVSSTNSFTERYGKNPKTSGQRKLYTPWGTVNTASPHLVPVNVRESSHSPGHGTRSTSRSPSQANESRRPQPNTFRVPSYSSSSSRSTKLSTSSLPSGFGNPIPGASVSRTTDNFLHSSAPFPSPSVRKSSAPVPQAPLSTLCNAGIVVAPVVSLPTLPFLPFDFNATSNESCHTRRQSEARYHVKEVTPQVTPRMNFTKAMPTPPSSDDGKILFKKDRSSSSSPSPFSTGCEARSTMRSDYRREFVRGDDCHRVHGDGTHLTLKSSGSQRRCQSPGWRYPVVLGQSY